MFGYELPTSIHLSGSKPKASLSKSPLTVMRESRGGGGRVYRARANGMEGWLYDEYNITHFMKPYRDPVHLYTEFR